jgi:hypothetical protein
MRVCLIGDRARLPQAFKRQVHVTATSWTVHGGTRKLTMPMSCTEQSIAYDGAVGEE